MRIRLGMPCFQMVCLIIQLSSPRYHTNSNQIISYRSEATFTTQYVCSSIRIKSKIHIYLCQWLWLIRQGSSGNKNEGRGKIWEKKQQSYIRLISYIISFFREKNNNLLTTRTPVICMPIHKSCNEHGNRENGKIGPPAIRQGNGEYFGKRKKNII